MYVFEMVTKAVLILAFVATGYSQIFDNDGCPEVQVDQDVDVSAYLGTWYELSRYWDKFQVNMKCYTGHISLSTNGSIEILHKYINTKDNTLQELKGIANPTNENSTEGRFMVTFPINTEISGEYFVLGTDYGNFSVIWSCLDVGSGGSFRNAWIWSRERNPSEAVVNASLSALRKNGIRTDLLLDADNKNCTFD